MNNRTSVGLTLCIVVAISIGAALPSTLSDPRAWWTPVWQALAFSLPGVLAGYFFIRRNPGSSSGLAQLLGASLGWGLVWSTVGFLVYGWPDPWPKGMELPYFGISYGLIAGGCYAAIAAPRRAAGHDTAIWSLVTGILGSVWYLVVMFMVATITHGFAQGASTWLGYDIVLAYSGIGAVSGAASFAFSRKKARATAQSGRVGIT